MTISSSNFEPLNPGLYSVKDRWNITQIGFQIDSHTQDSFPDIDQAELVIFNIPEYEGSENISSSIDCKIRDSIYRLYFDSLPKVADLGTMKIMNSRKETFDLIVEVCSDLISNGVIPIIIGGGHDISYGVYKSYSHLERSITMSCCDSVFNLGSAEDKLKASSFLSKIISYKPNYLFNYINLGHQTFFVNPGEVDLLNKLNFESYRLGDIQNNIQEIEPILRNTDFLSLDMSSIKSSSFASNFYSTPNGFNGQEICKIARYAGISDKISCFGIFEYNQELDQYNQGSQLIAQIIWYFIDGFRSRKHELNPNIKNCIKYTVAFNDGSTEIDFYKSKSSGRWWMGVPFENTKSGQINNYFVACSYDDYQSATKGEIPSRWIKTFNRFL